VAIPFTCPHCGAAQSAEDRYAGLSGPCTACGKTVQVPGGVAGQFTLTPPAKSSAGMGVVLMVVGVVSLMLLIGCGGIMAALLLPAMQAARQAARRVNSTNNVKQIMLAMHNYHDVHQEFPPAYIADADGQPMHSWRVLILPYLEQDMLHRQYDFNQPWDSPQNLAVAETMPAVYRSPLETSGPGSNHTSYLFFTGPGTLFDTTNGPPRRLSFAQITDGTSNTIALAEVNNSGVIWTQPTDLDTAQLDFIIRDLRDARPGQINSAHLNGTVMGFFDGSVRFISNRVSPQELRSAVDPRDGRAPNIDF
jgi:hypothetical protein